MGVEEIFVMVVNMSITASYIILAVLACRLLLGRFPRVFAYLLWLPVFFRLLCPVSFTAGFSLLGCFSGGAGASTPIVPAASAVHSVATAMEWAAPTAYQPPVWLTAAATLWAVVSVGLLLYGLVSFARLRHKLKTAVLLELGIYQSDRVTMPFVFGFLRPAIYLPVGIDLEQQRYILRHETIHIHRKDYLVKPIAFAAVCLHWFNPLAWLALLLVCRDMEMSCDEQVVDTMGVDVRLEYSRSLLAMAGAKGWPDPGIATFGETNVKRRIENVLHYKHPAIRTVIAAVCVVAVATVCLFANPLQAVAEPNPTPPATVPEPVSAPTAPISAPEAASLPPAPTSAPISDETQPPEMTMIWPVDGGYTSCGINGYKGHRGHDIAAQKGTAIYAAQAGTVTVAADVSEGGGYGRYIDLDHGSGWVTRYAQCNEVLVKVGDKVKQGDLIARVGQSGNATGNHLHFEVRYNDDCLNPADYIGLESPAKK